MDRRVFGLRVLQAAAALGLRKVSVQSVLGLGLGGLAGCGSESGRARGPDNALAPNDDGGMPPSGLDGSPGEPPETLTPRAEQRVIVVGSGYGSAVTAMRLTERGIPVTMIEMGKLWDKPGKDGKIFCTAFSPDERSMWFKDQTNAVVKNFGPFTTVFDVPRAAGVLDVLGNENMEVFVGRGVGGGSLVNMAIYVEPDRELFERTFPDVDADSMYSVYYPRARLGLKASMVPEDIVKASCYQYARVGNDSAQAAGMKTERCVSGYDYAYMAQEIAGAVPLSAVGGEAGYGNNYGKLSLDKSYIAEAIGTGLLTLLTLTKVKRITRADTGYVVHCEVIDADGKVVKNEELPCTHLFVGGGSLGTSELLVRARDSGDLPDLNAAVGTMWGPNSDIFVARDNPIWQPTGAVQATVPATAFRTRDQDDKAFFSMCIPFPVGIETFLSFHIVMVENSEAGHFIYDSIKDEVLLRWDASQNEPAVKSARFVFDKLNSVSGTSYNTGLFGGPVMGDKATYHPVGGCPLGRATDAYGRLPNYPGLYVTDSALIPVGIGANPSLTVTALAERNIERILAEDLEA